MINKVISIIFNTDSLAIGAGIDIGIDYDDELPDIVTKQQTGSWDVRAYIS